jgi:deoxyribodipyrimidine photo-lyase
VSAIIVWLRRDLRLADSPALRAAAATGGPVIPVFVLDDAADGRWRIGAAARWWLHHSLKALGAAYRARGTRLRLRRGDSIDALVRLAHQVRAGMVLWNRMPESGADERESALAARLKAEGIGCQAFDDGLLYAPEAITTQTGDGFRVFTPFWRACLRASPPRPPAPAPTRLTDHAADIGGDDLDAWGLIPSKPDWAAEFLRDWTPGESGAQARLARFLDHALPGYSERRDRPDLEATSRLAPHLHWGEISPRQVWHAIGAVDAPAADRGKFLSELGWREFNHHLLARVPSLPERSLDQRFNRFAWREDDAAFRAWSRGRTGVPIVDAAMRQLWRTGWMHNRMRMVVASFLVKHLMQPWQRGAAWFWDTLVDADLANNAANWQWVAGCGADAAPYFRIFNPVRQSERFDPEGDYVRRYVPELAELPARWIHEPHRAPRDVLDRAGVRLGDTFPRPIVDLAMGRRRALAAYDSLGKAAS